MPLLPDLSERVLTPELMDDPALDAREHLAALAGLRRVNLASRTAAALWRHLLPMARSRSLGTPDRPLRVLDIATGSADVPLALARIARRHALNLDIAACDVSPRAVAQATARARGAVRVFTHDALDGDLPEGHDVLTCALFLHHLEREQVVSLLARMARAARVGVLVSDLRRTRAGYALAWLASRCFSTSRVVRVDALLSVRAAFTVDELRAMATEAGMTGGTVAPCWPQRMLLRWERPA